GLFIDLDPRAQMSVRTRTGGFSPGGAHIGRIAVPLLVHVPSYLLAHGIDPFGILEDTPSVGTKILVVLHERPKHLLNLSREERLARSEVKGPTEERPHSE